jgi:ferredoxin-NADP reductase
MIRTIHPVAGVLAFVMISIFWLSTLASELFGDAALVTAVKTAIPYGFLILVPSIAAAGGSGMALARGVKTGRAGAKARRMPIIGANGLLILIPAAFYLASKARAGEFDAPFYLVQGVELVAGATNLLLLGLNMRDGLQLTGRLKRAGAMEARLLAREVVGEATLVLRFSRPPGFAHLAGQHVALSLPAAGAADARGLTRTLTIASAPDDADLLFATRISGSAFKQAAQAMPIGATARIGEATGDFVLAAQAQRPVVFIAGGVGVTPFRAMIRHAVRARWPHRITLFHVCRRAADAVFLDELRATAGSDGTIRVVATLTDPPPDWSGETGRISPEMLRRHLGDPAAALYFLAGPPAMVEASRQALGEIGVPPGDIRSEEFFGY